jgi:tryptophanyl-tRNA synthetase
MELVKEILLDGEAKAQVIARHTMQEVRTAMRLGETTFSNHP